MDKWCSKVHRNGDLRVIHKSNDYLVLAKFMNRTFYKFGLGYDYPSATWIKYNVRKCDGNVW